MSLAKLDHLSALARAIGRCRVDAEESFAAAEWWYEGALNSYAMRGYSASAWDSLGRAARCYEAARDALRSSIRFRREYAVAAAALHEGRAA